MQTVVETPSYLKAAEGIFNEEEREAIVAMVSANPECGDLIQGTRGISEGQGEPGRHGQAWWSAGNLYSSQMKTSQSSWLRHTRKTKRIT